MTPERMMETLEGMATAFLLGDFTSGRRLAYEIFIEIEWAKDNFVALGEALLEILPDKSDDFAREWVDRLVLDMDLLARTRRLYTLLQERWPEGVIGGHTGRAQDLIDPELFDFKSNAWWVTKEGPRGSSKTGSKKGSKTTNRLQVQYEIDIGQNIQCAYIEMYAGEAENFVVYADYELLELDDPDELWIATVRMIESALPSAAEEAWANGLRSCSCGKTHLNYQSRSKCPLCKGGA